MELRVHHHTTTQSHNDTRHSTHIHTMGNTQNIFYNILHPTTYKIQLRTLLDEFVRDTEPKN